MIMMQTGMVKQGLNSACHTYIDDDHPAPTFTPPELPKRVHVRGLSSGEITRDREDINLINRVNRTSRNSTAMPANGPNQLQHNNTKQVNKVKPNVNRQPPDSVLSPSSYNRAPDTEQSPYAGYQLAYEVKKLMYALFNY
uniref:CSON005103 protein n=1 Tax=Culicoides sonorensis TaxID=179676 RepID=A0A336MTW9_CULSO